MYSVEVWLEEAQAVGQLCNRVSFERVQRLLGEFNIESEWMWQRGKKDVGAVGLWVEERRWVDKGNTQLSEFSLSLLWLLKLHLQSKTHLLTLDVYTCFSHFWEFGFISFLVFNPCYCIFFFNTGSRKIIQTCLLIVWNCNLFNILQGLLTRGVQCVQMKFGTGTERSKSWVAAVSKR